MWGVYTRKKRRTKAEKKAARTAEQWFPCEKNGCEVCDWEETNGCSRRGESNPPPNDIFKPDNTCLAYIHNLGWVFCSTNLGDAPQSIEYRRLHAQLQRKSSMSFDARVKLQEQLEQLMHEWTGDELEA